MKSILSSNETKAHNQAPAVIAAKEAAQSCGLGPKTGTKRPTKRLSPHTSYQTKRPTAWHATLFDNVTRDICTHTHLHTHTLHICTHTHTTHTHTLHTHLHTHTCTHTHTLHTHVFAHTFAHLANEDAWHLLTCPGLVGKFSGFPSSSARSSYRLAQASFEDLRCIWELDRKAMGGD